MSFDDYMNARMISTPFCLYDCDVPCDGATAVIVSRRDRAQGPAATRRCASRRSGTRIDGRPSWDQFDDLSTMPNRDAGQAAVGAHRPEALRRADGAALRRVLVAHDVVARGARACAASARAARSSTAATRIARDGELPLNTHGGQLSAGRLHGYGFLHEGATQMWGEAGDRQIATPARGRRHRRRRRQHLRLPPPRPRVAPPVAVARSVRQTHFPHQSRNCAVWRAFRPSKCASRRGRMRR